MATTQYIGARYVPIFVGEWDNNRTYEPLMVVTYQGASYTSRQYVPAGIEITNESYWVLSANYNAQVEAYRKEVRDILPYDETPTEDSTKGVTSDGIKKAIAAETTRATTAEKVNADAIAAETTRATTAEKVNADAIGAETTRATNAESILSSELNDISGIRHYANVSAMQADADIRNANNFKFAMTDNFYGEADNGGSIYKIVDTATADGKSVFALQNGKYAVFVSATKYLNVDCFGAKKDDDTFDNAPIFNYMLDTFGFADFYGHYHVSTTIKVKDSCKLMSSKSNFLALYGYIGKDKFPKVNNVIYCDDNNSFETNAAKFKSCIYVENGTIDNVTVTNISATAQHIYVPGFDGIFATGKDISEVTRVCASGFNTGIFARFGACFKGFKVYVGACVVCIKMSVSDSTLDNFNCNTNVHMVPTIASNLGTNDNTVYPAGLIVYGGNNTISNGKIEWTYYGLVDSMLGNAYSNILFDWNYDGVVEPNFAYQDWGVSLISNCLFYSQNRHIDLLATIGKLQVSNCGFYTSDGSAKAVLEGDNIKPTGSAFSIYPGSDSSSAKKCMFTMDNCDIAHATTYTNNYWCLRYNPYVYAAITNCYIGSKSNPTNQRMYTANNYNIVESS